jgi:hypothetical protein
MDEEPKEEEEMMEQKPMPSSDTGMGLMSRGIS